jgi:hypothetical protein
MFLLGIVSQNCIRNPHGALNENSYGEHSTDNSYEKYLTGNPYEKYLNENSYGKFCLKIPTKKCSRGSSDSPPGLLARK